jgi:hypothetical protein
MGPRSTGYHGRGISWACVTLIVTLGVSDCSPAPAKSSAPGPASASVFVDAAPAGFATAALVVATPAPVGSKTGAGAPNGSVWYRLSAGAASTDSSGPALEWYVHGQNLSPARAYRIELSVDWRDIYTVGNGRTDTSGTMTVHGVLHQFAEQYCISAPTSPRPLTGWQTLAFAVKSDGAGTGSASPVSGGPLTGLGRDNSCSGNGDGNFDYWLSAPHAITPGDAGIERGDR